MSLYHMIRMLKYSLLFNPLSQRASDSCKYFVSQALHITTWYLTYMDAPPYVTCCRRVSPSSANHAVNTAFAYKLYKLPYNLSILLHSHFTFFSLSPLSTILFRLIISSFPKKQPSVFVFVVFAWIIHCYIPPTAVIYLTLGEKLYKTIQSFVFILTLYVLVIHDVQILK